MKKNTIKTIIALCLCALFCVSALVACASPPDPVTNGFQPAAAPLETEAVSRAYLSDSPATEEPTEEPTYVPVEETNTIDPELIETAWTFAEKIEKVHEQQFNKTTAEVLINAHFTTVRFTSVTYPDEMLCITLEKDEEGQYKTIPEFTTVEASSGSVNEPDGLHIHDALIEKLEELGNTHISVTADEIRAAGCEAEIGSNEYNNAVATIYGEKLVAYYRDSLNKDSPFCCYDVRFVDSEKDTNSNLYGVHIGFRVRDILPFFHLFDYIPCFDSGTFHPGYEGWLVGWTLLYPDYEDDGSFICNAVMNGAG